MLLLSGCGDLSAAEVEAVADDFARAGEDPGARCALLAASTLTALVGEESASCEEAIQQVPLGTGSLTAVEVWGEEAQAKLTDDTIFLTRTGEGWRVSAAACTAQGEGRPYECRLEGS
jgi:hypothetical protein